MATVIACPYCHHALAKMPQRRSMCKACKQLIYIKGTPSDRTKRLMTEAEAMAAEAEWGAYHAKAKAAENMRVIGLGTPDLEKAQRDYGLEPDEAAVVLATLVSEDPAADLLHRKIACDQLARDCEVQREPFQEHMRRAHFFDLHMLRLSGVRTVEIVAMDNACKACKRLDGRKYSVRAAIVQLPLPCPDCTTETIHGDPGYCRCSWKIGPE